MHLTHAAALAAVVVAPQAPTASPSHSRCLDVLALQASFMGYTLFAIPALWVCSSLRHTPARTTRTAWHSTAQGVRGGSGRAAAGVGDASVPLLSTVVHGSFSEGRPQTPGALTATPSSANPSTERGGTPGGVVLGNSPQGMSDPPSFSTALGGSMGNPWPSTDSPGTGMGTHALPSPSTGSKGRSIEVEMVSLETHG